MNTSNCRRKNRAHRRAKWEDVQTRALPQLGQQDRHHRTAGIAVKGGPSFDELLQHPDQVRDALSVSRLHGDAPVSDFDVKRRSPALTNSHLHGAKTWVVAKSILH